MTKLAIFDLDGTLLNTVEDLGDATNYALTQCGFPTHKLDEYYQMVGRGIYNLFRAAVPSDQATEDIVQRMASYFIPYYDVHKCDRTRPYSGIPEMLRTISDRGVRLAVASNKYQDGAEKLVRHFFGEYDFVRILGQRDGQRYESPGRLCRRLECRHADRGERQGPNNRCHMGIQEQGRTRILQSIGHSGHSGNPLKRDITRQNQVHLRFI